MSMMATPVCDTSNDAEIYTCVQCDSDGDCTLAAPNTKCSSAFPHTCLLPGGALCTMNSQCASNSCNGTGGTTCN